MSWQIALYGTSTYYALDTKGQVAFETMSITDPMEDEGWLVLDIYGISPRYETESNFQTSVGGNKTGRPRQRLTMDVKLNPIIFDDGLAEFNSIKDVLKNRYLYFYSGTYPISWLHEEDTVLRVIGEVSVEDDYPAGVKMVTIKLEKVKIES